MFLQEIFFQRGYRNIIDEINDFKEDFNIEYFHDGDKIPEELLGVYISPHWDELFLILSARGQDVNELCEKWDKKISIFMIFGSDKKDIIKKMKYNVIQIILHENGIEDRTQEGSLKISRKILLSCTICENGGVWLDEDAVLELPFVLISPTESTQKVDIMAELMTLMPLEGTDMEFLVNPRKKERKKLGEDGRLVKSFSKEFEQIKEWLTRNDNTEN